MAKCCKRLYCGFSTNDLQMKTCPECGSLLIPERESQADFNYFIITEINRDDILTVLNSVKMN